MTHVTAVLSGYEVMGVHRRVAHPRARAVFVVFPTTPDDLGAVQQSLARGGSGMALRRGIRARSRYRRRRHPVNRRLSPRPLNGSCPHRSLGARISSGYSGRDFCHDIAPETCIGKHTAHQPLRHFCAVAYYKGSDHPFE